MADLHPFTDVTIYAPRAAGPDGTAAPAVFSRSAAELVTYGWTPQDFIREGLLQYLFTDDDDSRTQVGMVEQRCRVQLARFGYPAAGGPGAVVLRTPPATTSFVFDRIVTERRHPVHADAATAT